MKKLCIIIYLSIIGVFTQNVLAQTTPDLVLVAESPQLWTGIAVSNEGRMFVNFPRWFPNVPISVAELASNDSLMPYPNEEWNNWHPESSAKDYFVCVQSVYLDRTGDLWILDAGTHRGKIIENGPKLVNVDIKKDTVLHIYYFDSSIAPEQSYLNDVRIDKDSHIAYITDSGLGAIVVVNLKTGQSRRLLVNDKSTQAEDVVLTIEGIRWLRPDGSAPKIHADGLALTPAGDYLYYQALTGHTLYRIKTEFLNDQSLNATALSKKVEIVGKFGAADGIEFDAHGNLYLSALEKNAILRLSPDNKLETLVQSPLLKWPDSFSITIDNSLYVTCSQLHLIGQTDEPFKIFKVSSRK